FWPSGQASTTLTASATLTVTGVTASSTASNLLLRVLLDGEPLVSNRFTIIKVDLVPNYDRDDDIDSEDVAKAAAREPFHFWINDDDDSGADGGNDIPGDGSADSVNGSVDGVRDLVDFFPVWVDIKDTLSVLPMADYDYVLKHAGGALNAFACNSLPISSNPDLKPNAHLYSTSFGDTYGTYNVGQITASGLTLPQGFLSEILNNDRGIVLLEGRSATTDPLVLEIRRKSDSATICEKEMPLSLSGVEDMYRWINLRGVANGPVSRTTDLSEPDNYPDALCSSKSVAFLHGYSVNEEAARGWNAEMFKRMYWTGSRAKFYAVTWFGNDSQQSWLGGKTPDYHVNVVHALDTAGALASNLNNHVGGDITLAAHSLGNVLSSAAIAKHGANVANYFMIDGAVAMEAFDGSPSLQDNNMWYTDWPSYGEWLWCSEWYTNFPSGDGRHALTWRDTFSSGASVAYNFYSSGEDVLKTHPHTTYPGLWCYFGGEYAWALQEKRKGLNWISSIGGSTYGGWGFNDYYWDNDLSTYVPPTNMQAILSRPFFRPGGSELADLYVPTDTNQTDVGSQYATDHLHFLLAGFIPSRTLPMGANRLTTWPTTRNYNMQHTDVDEGFQNSWPSGRSSTDWYHSDLREVAYLYVYKLFDKFRDLGGLDQP
ncbi:MAG: hypothetical protein GX621_13385, partial [Pirellulaceae bacterium]|nr:hypothetical protein [Pirellulaceae bacterium]